MIEMKRSEIHDYLISNAGPNQFHTDSEEKLKKLNTIVFNQEKRDEAILIVFPLITT